MKLEKFKEKNWKKNGIIIGSAVLVVLIAAVIIYRSFAFYEEEKSFNIIKGQVPDQNYDTMVSFYVEDDAGNQNFVETMPTENGHNYSVTASCDNGATGTWDYDRWVLIIDNLTTTRTKCKLIFGPPKPLMNFGITEEIVTTGTGLYEVTHEDASITYTGDEVAINTLKQTEYRYAGKNPNNYVTFNGEEAGWRIIGLVNTPEGQRLKLVRATSIGNYSWDSSAFSINGGLGINEWSQADLMTTLNSGTYYNKTSGICYSGQGNVTTPCDFSSNGLTDEAKKMIDIITWNTGTRKGGAVNPTAHFYNYERSNNTGNVCSGGTYCNDTVTRKTTWKGQIGLMYPSDYGYATSGGSTTNRDTCINTILDSWNNYSDCYGNDWIYNGSQVWLLTAELNSQGSTWVATLGDSGALSGNCANSQYGVTGVLPTLYLKSNVKIVNGNGKSDNPYVLSI